MAKKPYYFELKFSSYLGISQREGGIPIPNYSGYSIKWKIETIYNTPLSVQGTKVPICK